MVIRKVEWVRGGVVEECRRRKEYSGRRGVRDE